MFGDCAHDRNFRGNCRMIPVDRTSAIPMMCSWIIRKARMDGMSDLHSKELARVALERSTGGVTDLSRRL
jgi:hypothetical protein